MHKRINKIKWRSTRRALLEVDLYLENFLTNYPLENMDNCLLNCYEQFIELNDYTIIDILHKKKIVEDNDLNLLISLIINAQK